jgi:FkbH-like protein
MGIDDLGLRRAGMMAYQFGNRVLGVAQASYERVLANTAIVGRGERDGLYMADALWRGRRGIVEGWWSTQFDVSRLRRFGVPADELPPKQVLLRAYLIPLLQLLRAWIRTGQARYADVYLDERLRYAPHQAGLDERKRFFDEVVPRDEEFALRTVPKGLLRSALRERLGQLHAPLRQGPAASPLRVFALGDCLMNEVRVALVSRCRSAGIPLDFRGHYFSATGAGLSVDAPRAVLRTFPAQVIALSFLSYKGIVPFATLMREADRLKTAEVEQYVDAIAAIIRDFLCELRRDTDAPFIVHNASGLPLSPLRRLVPLLSPLSPAHEFALERVNAAVADVVTHTRNTILMDEAGVARKRGLRACLERMVPQSIAPGADFHTARFGEYLVPGYVDVLHSFRALSHCKVLAVDFDNTLWDGVMADGGVVQRHDLQKALRRLKEGGIVLVAVSKNDPKNIRWSEMTLQPDDFVLQKINWDLKVKSIREAAQELDVGLDSFVLLDDNPAERELVRTEFPQVGSIDPNSPDALVWLERMLCFPNVRETEEARKRTEMYRQQAARRTALQAPLDYPTMMARLQLTARFSAARDSDIDRVVELVQRTNQFNTTTIRYSRQDLLGFMGSPTHGVYASTLSDKFGSMGLVAVAVVRRNGRERVIESFVMSCRAMGFGLEQLVLRRVLDAEGGPDIHFVGRYVPTERNSPCSRLYEEHGFVRRTDTEWFLAPDAERPEAPAWFS